MGYLAYIKMRRRYYRALSFLFTCVIHLTHSQAQIVVRYLDPYTLKGHHDFRAGYIRLYLQNFGQGWQAIAYYSDETKLLIATFSDSTAKNLNGPFALFNRNGYKQMATNFVDGKLDGPLYIYSSTGEIMEQCTYKSGLKEGPFKSYYPGGKILATAVYKEDLPEGFFRYYHPDSQIASEQFFASGKLKSETCFDEAGHKRSCAVFRARLPAYPAYFEKMAREKFTFSKNRYRGTDTVLYLQVVIDRDGKLLFSNLFRRKDGATGKLANSRLFWETMQGITPELESVGSPELRDEIRNRLAQIPAIVPAYEHNIRMPFLDVLEVHFK